MIKNIIEKMKPIIDIVTPFFFLVVLITSFALQYLSNIAKVKQHRFINSINIKKTRLTFGIFDQLKIPKHKIRNTVEIELNTINEISNFLVAIFLKQQYR